MNDVNGLPRTAIVQILLALAFVVIIAKLAHLHLDPPEALIRQAQTATIYTRTLPAVRGRILDGGRSPNILAMSLATHDVCANPKRLRETTNLDLAVSLLAESLTMTPEEVRHRLRFADRPFAYIRRFVPRDVSERLWVQVTNSALPPLGVYLEESTIRHYPQGTLACHAVGFVNREGAGNLGVELTCDRLLRGEPGLIRGIQNRRAQEIVPSRLVEKPARPGADVYLTVDSQIQYFAERALDEAIERHAAKSAWAVVQRCRTGEILALASRPAFDLNAYGGEPDLHRMTNRAIGVVYEPGSTLKPVAVALALARGLVTPEQEFDCENGSWLHARRLLRDYHPYARLAVADIVKKSSNIGSAKIALLLGDAALHDGLKAFGFGRRLGLELPGEEAGILAPPSRWSAISSSRIAIGQGVAVTAVQMAGMMSAIANGGYLLKPTLIRKVVNPDGTVEKAAEPVVLGRPLDARTAALMRYLLARVTEPGGTGTRARVPGFTVAGKTGTAQKPVRGGYSDTAYMASFAGFLPAEGPEITLVVVVEEPQPLHTGGMVAAPVFARIAEQTVRYLNLEPIEAAADAAAASGDG